MQRREFITLIGGAAAAWPLNARAQQPVKLATIGYMGPNTPSVDSYRLPAFVQRLRELGWIEGRTVAIEYRWAEGRSERLAEIAAEFVQRKVDVIVTAATLPTAAAKQATSTIPIGSPPWGIRSAPAWSLRWLVRAAMSLVCRCSKPIAPASDWNCCERSFPVCGIWRSWPTAAIPLPYWICARLRQLPTQSA